MERHYPIDDSSTAHAIHVRVLRAHVSDAVRLPGTDHIDPQAWDPLIMKFCDYFGDSQPLIPSRLAAGWRMPGRLEEPTRRVALHITSSRASIAQAAMCRGVVASMCA